MTFRRLFRVFMFLVWVLSEAPGIRAQALGKPGALLGQTHNVGLAESKRVEIGAQPAAQESWSRVMALTRDDLLRVTLKEGMLDKQRLVSTDPSRIQVKTATGAIAAYDRDSVTEIAVYKRGSNRMGLATVSLILGGALGLEASFQKNFGRARPLALGIGWSLVGFGAWLAQPTPMTVYRANR